MYLTRWLESYKTFNDKEWADHTVGRSIGIVPVFETMRLIFSIQTSISLCEFALAYKHLYFVATEKVNASKLCSASMHSFTRVGDSSHPNA